MWVILKIRNKLILAYQFWEAMVMLVLRYNDGSNPFFASAMSPNGKAILLSTERIVQLPQSSHLFSITWSEEKRFFLYRECA
jgi:hypothetical protein